METDQVPLNPAVCKMQSWILQLFEPISKVSVWVVTRITCTFEVRIVVRVRACVRYVWG